MKTGSHWRDACRPIIANAIAAWNGEDECELRKVLYELYPFGERKMYPYKVWLSEIAFQMKKKKTYWNPIGRKLKAVKRRLENEKQMSMFEAAK